MEYKYLPLTSLKRLNKTQLKEYLVNGEYPLFNKETAYKKSELINLCIQLQKLKKNAVSVDKEEKVQSTEEMDTEEPEPQPIEAEKLHPEEITMIELEEDAIDKDKKIEHLQSELLKCNQIICEINEPTDHPSLVWKNRYDRLMKAYRKLLEENIEIKKELAITETIVKVS